MTALGTSAAPPAAPPTTTIALRELTKAYGPPRQRHWAIRGVTLDFASGSFTAVMGPSGSGKSTLLHCAAGLDRPTSGSVRLGDVELTGLSERALTKLRRTHAAFVFQAYNLVPALTVQQNVTLPGRLAGVRPDRARVRAVLEEVGLSDRARHRPDQLSGGQQQRVAIARALISRPPVLFADEPTGALDLRSSRTILTLLRQTVDNVGQTVLMVTHDPTAAAYADRVVFIADGQLVGEMTDPTPDSVAHRLTELRA